MVVTPHMKLSEDEKQEIASGPAVHSNKIYLTMTGAGARLTFMDQLELGMQPTFRVAVLLSYPDALELRDLITRQLKDIEADLRKFKSDPPEEGPANG